MFLCNTSCGQGNVLWSGKRREWSEKIKVFCEDYSGWTPSQFYSHSKPSHIHISCYVFDIPTQNKTMFMLYGIKCIYFIVTQNNKTMSIYGSGHEAVAVLLPGFAIN